MREVPAHSDDTEEGPARNHSAQKSKHVDWWDLVLRMKKNLCTIVRTYNELVHRLSRGPDHPDCAYRHIGQCLHNTIMSNVGLQPHEPRRINASNNPYRIQKCPNPCSINHGGRPGDVLKESHCRAISSTLAAQSLLVAILAPPIGLDSGLIPNFNSMWRHGNEEGIYHTLARAG